MSSGYIVLDDGHVVIAKWGGKITYEAIEAHERKRSADDSIQPDAVMLIDGRFARFDNVREMTGELSELIGQLHREKRIAKLALLVPQEDFVQAKLHEKENLSRGLNTIVFNSLGVACKWLGIDYDIAFKYLKEMDLK